MNVRLNFFTQKKLGKKNWAKKIGHPRNFRRNLL